jgi:hypothetical protein
MTTGEAIKINVNNVVIDLNGHKLGGGSAGPGTETRGIYANGRKNITIKNGTVRGFMYGILLNDDPPYTISQGHMIEDIRADMNTSTGIAIVGRANIIRNNQVVDTGGSSKSIHATGILIWGPGNRVINNDVYETKEQTASGEAAGIVASHASGNVIGNNRVGNAELGAGTSYGIGIADSANAIVKDNTISVMNYGIFFNPLFTGATGIYMNNLASGCTTAFSGGTPAGSTNYSN